MTISSKDIKILWSRAAGRCAICRLELTQDAKLANSTFPLGEMAHIVGKEESSARSTSILTKEERDQYSNLILLCPNDHKKIDRDERQYPVEMLHKIKSDHEDYVKYSLEENKILTDVDIYKNVMNLIEEKMHLKQWDMWSQYLLNARPSMPIFIYRDICDLIVSINRTLWPNTIIEYETVVKHLIGVLKEVNKSLEKHMESDGSHYYVNEIYRIGDWDEPRYKKMLNEYNKTVDALTMSTQKLCASLNMYSDYIRKYVDGNYRRIEGKFILIESSIFEIESKVYEYKKEKKDQILREGDYI